MPETDGEGELQQTTFRLTKRDRAIIEDERRRVGLATRTEALRFILRAWVDCSEANERKKRGGR